MKAVKTILVWVCVTMVGICVKVQAADEGAKPMGKMQALLESNDKNKDWKIMFGLKVWNNEWDVPVELRAYDKTYILEFESDAAVTPIPALLVWYRNFFIGGSYLLDTDYDFTPQELAWWSRSIDDEEEVFNYYNWDLDVSGSRKEWDVNIGYFITPNIAMSLGYKSLERKLTTTFTDVTDSTSFFTNKYPLSVTSDTVGRSSNASFTEFANPGSAINS